MANNAYYIFDDQYEKFTPEERKPIEDEIIKHVPSGPISWHFNSWRFTKSGGRFFATRLTWDLGGMVRNSAEELAKHLQEYHGKLRTRELK